MNPSAGLSSVNRFNFEGVDRFHWRAGWPDEHPARMGGASWNRSGSPSFMRKDWLLSNRTIGCSCVRISPQCAALSAANRPVLHVPPDHVTGSVNLSENTILMILSSGSINDAKNDDFRFRVGQ